MAGDPRFLGPRAVAPLAVAPAGACRLPSPPLPPLLARLGCAVIGLALPALGVALADTVHRVGEPRAMQAAVPLGGAAAARSGRTLRPIPAGFADIAPPRDAGRGARP